MTNKAVIIGNIAGAGYRIKKSLDRAGFQSDFLISDNELSSAGDPSWEDTNAINGKDYITFSKYTESPDTAQFTKRTGLKDILNFLKLRSTCRKNKYDFGFAMGIWPILLNSFSMPYIWLCAGSDVREVLAGDSMKSFLLKRSLKSCKGIITPADDSMLKVLYRFFPKEKVFIIPNYPIDTVIYTPKKRTSPEFVIYHPSRHLWHSKAGSESKANDLLIQAVSKLSQKYQIKLVMAEWGADLSHSKELVQKLGMEDIVEWHGMVTKPKMVTYYQNSDCVVDHVGWGMVSQTTLEGLACGKPTLANMSSSVEEMFPDIPVFNVGSEEECIQAIEKLILDKNFYDTTSAVSREWIDKNWSTRVMGHKIIDFMNSL